ncbi:extracellular solute-binding protein [Caballeronia arationis]|jgi:oligopeptide transport system substrate-binding protein|nr:extracellular solute-binding protein [Caballeronia arationis]
MTFLAVPATRPAHLVRAFQSNGFSARSRALSAMLAAVFGTVAVCANAANVPSGVQLAAKQELVRNNASEVETLDPNLVESVPANNVSEDLFEGLTVTDAEGNVQPGVAQKWEQKDATTWIFHLRKNAKWSTGEAVTANDFVYGCQRLVDPKLASPSAETFGKFLLNGAEIIAGKKPVSELGVRAIDANTLELKTPNPVPFLPDLVSNTTLGPVNKAAVEKYGRDWTKPGKLVSNGAYQLKECKSTASSCW